MAQEVGFIVLEAVLAPICDPQEPIYSELVEIEGGVEQEVRKVIREYVKPYFDSFDIGSRDVIAASICYFARGGRPPEDVALDALPTPFELPSDIGLFCNWLAEELAIDVTGCDLMEYQYTNDLSVVHRLRRDRRK